MLFNTKEYVARKPSDICINVTTATRIIATALEMRRTRTEYQFLWIIIIRIWFRTSLYLFIDKKITLYKRKLSNNNVVHFFGQFQFYKLLKMLKILTRSIQVRILKIIIKIFTFYVFCWLGKYAYRLQMGKRCRAPWGQWSSKSKGKGLIKNNHIKRDCYLWLKQLFPFLRYFI